MDHGNGEYDDDTAGCGGATTSRGRQRRQLVLVVTGASRGFGRAAALEFCSRYGSTGGGGAAATSSAAEEEYVVDAAHVVLVSRSAQGLEETKRDVLRACNNVSSDSSDNNGNVETDREVQRQPRLRADDVSVFPADLSDLDKLDDELDRLFDTIIRSKLLLPSSTAVVPVTTRLVLVNNAGTIGAIGRCSDTPYTLREMRQNVDLNVTSACWVSARFAKFASELRQKHRDGIIASAVEATIVNVSSLVAVQSFPSMGLYSAGKAARDAYHVAIAKEEKETMTDISAGELPSSSSVMTTRVLNYAPGPLETDMTEEIRHASSQGRLDESLRAAFERKLVDPRDSARVLVDLVMTGTRSGGQGQTPSFESGAHVDYYDVVGN